MGGCMFVLALENTREWSKEKSSERGRFGKRGSEDPQLQKTPSTLAFVRGAVRTSRFDDASRAEETGLRWALRLLWRGCGVSRGGRPRGEYVFCASRRRSTETGRTAKSHSQECKTPETP